MQGRGRRAAPVVMLLVALTAALAALLVVFDSGARAATSLLGLSFDETTWATNITGQLFTNPAKIVPGDTSTGEFFVRNQSGVMATMEVRYMMPDTELMDSGLLTVQAMVGSGGWQTLTVTPDFIIIPPASTSLGDGAIETVMVRATLDISAGNDMMHLTQPLTFQVTLMGDSLPPTSSPTSSPTTGPTTSPTTSPDSGTTTSPRPTSGPTSNPGGGNTGPGGGNNGGGNNGGGHSNPGGGNNGGGNGPGGGNNGGGGNGWGNNGGGNPTGSLGPTGLSNGSGPGNGQGSGNPGAGGLAGTGIPGLGWTILLAGALVGVGAALTSVRLRGRRG